MVIIAVPSDGNGGLNEQMNQRLGRCPSFTFVTIKDNNIEEVRSVPNHASEAMGGAGVQAVQIIGNNEAEAVIVGFLGPNAAQALNALNLKIYQAPDRPITVKDVIQLYFDKKLQLITSANVTPHHGMGQGRGMGGGYGMRHQNRGQF